MLNKLKLFITVWFNPMARGQELSKKFIHLHEIISNPTMSKNTFPTYREKDITAVLKSKYNSLMLSHNKKLTYKAYKTANGYYFHFLIPSQTLEDLFYDVIIDFSPDPNFDPTELEKETQLHKYIIKFYSNAPNFMFTYTYVAANRGWIPQELIKFCSKEALTSPPSIRNPEQEYGYEKSIYFAALYIMNNKLYIKKTIEKEIYKHKDDTFKHTIMSQEKKFAEYTKKQQDKAKKKRFIKKVNKVKAFMTVAAERDKVVKKQLKKFDTAVKNVLHPNPPTKQQKKAGTFSRTRRPSRTRPSRPKRR